ncbi:MAG: hypothetical protein K1X86_11840 [Ignavibacteria bacterium]|nr:hypothetical protein [Ignavibacteria bacterium]
MFQFPKQVFPTKAGKHSDFDLQGIIPIHTKCSVTSLAIKFRWTYLQYIVNMK